MFVGADPESPLLVPFKTSMPGHEIGHAAESTAGWIIGAQEATVCECNVFNYNNNIQDPPLI